MMGLAKKSLVAAGLFIFSSSFAFVSTITNAAARDTRVLNLSSPGEVDSNRSYNRRHKRKLRKHTRNHNRSLTAYHSRFLRRRFKDHGNRTSTITGLKPAKRCFFTWHEDNGYGYRKLNCQKKYKSRFAAHRPWAYRDFRKTAKWDQSRAWQGRFHPNPRNLYEGKLKQTDHGRQVQGNPYQYRDNSRRYQQSTMFGQKIYYPRAAWQ